MILPVCMLPKIQIFRFGPGKHDFKMNLKGSGTLKNPPPSGIQMYKGYKNVVLTRLTAKFIARHPISHQFLGE